MTNGSTRLGTVDPFSSPIVGRANRTVSGIIPVTGYWVTELLVVSSVTVFYQTTEEQLIKACCIFKLTHFVISIRLIITHSVTTGKYTILFIISHQRRLYNNKSFNSGDMDMWCLRPWQHLECFKQGAPKHVRVPKSWNEVFSYLYDFIYRQYLNCTQNWQIIIRTYNFQMEI